MTYFDFKVGDKVVYVDDRGQERSEEYLSQVGTVRWTSLSSTYIEDVKVGDYLIMVELDCGFELNVYAKRFKKVETVDYIADQEDDDDDLL